MQSKTNNQADERKAPLHPDFRIGVLSLVGLLGFIVGCVILFYPDLLGKGDKTVFHEIKYVPKEIAGKDVQNAIKALDSMQADRLAIKNILADSLKTNDPVKKMTFTKLTAELDQQSATADADIKTLKSLQASYENTSSNDTTSFKNLNKALHFNIGPRELDSFDKAIEKNRHLKITTDYVLIDPRLSLQVKGKAVLESVEPQSDIAFISKYPGVGIWILLNMIFCSFLFVAISTSFYLRDKITQFFKENNIEGVRKSEYNLVTVVTFLCLVLVWVIGRITFNDEDMIRGIYFMYHIKTSMLALHILGFLAGACCLSGFIYTASLLAFFAKSVKDSRKMINSKKVALAAVNNGQGSGSPDPVKGQQDQDAELNSTIEKEKKDREVFEKLNGFFKTYFIISAIILSLLVLCTGGLYGIINSLDFVNLLTDDWGYSPARNDFIYLYGGLYTVILLLVYIPAKMRFSEISFAGESTEKSKTDTGGKFFDLLKNPFSQLKEMMVAASPLLASLVQSLFQALFG